MRSYKGVRAAVATIRLSKMPGSEVVAEIEGLIGAAISVGREASLRRDADSRPAR